VQIEQRLVQLPDLLANRRVGSVLQSCNEFLHPAEPLLKFFGARFLHSFF
jgi:hypothetical protein